MLETTSFDDIQIAVCRGSRDMKTDPGPQNSVPGMLETMNFHGVKIAVKHGSLHIEIVPGPQNKVL